MWENDNGSGWNDSVHGEKNMLKQTGWGEAVFKPGFWEGLGETFFGTTSKKKAAEAQDKAIKTQEELLNIEKAQIAKQNAAADAYRGYTDTLKDTAGNYGDAMGNARNVLGAADAYGSQQGKQQMQVATKNALAGGRTAGLNPAQAAMLASQQGAGAYDAGRTAGVNQFTGQTQAAYANQLNTQGQKLGALAQGVDNTRIGGNLAGHGANSSNLANGLMQGKETGIGGNLLSGIATIGAAYLMSKSDARQKQKITRAQKLDELLKGIKPVQYEYKKDVAAETPNGEGVKVGILAQDLEKTPLGSTVIDTPEGKKVDTAQLTTANTAMLAQMYEEIKDIKARLNTK